LLFFIIESNYTKAPEMKLVSWTLKRLWQFLAEMGVFSESPRHLLGAFNFLAHVNGRLYYQMKHPRKWTQPPRRPLAFPRKYAGHICSFSFDQLLRRADVKPGECAVAKCYKTRPNPETGEDGRVLEHEAVVPFADMPSFTASIGQQADVIMSKNFVSRKQRTEY